MQVMKETPGQSALTIDESASVLGLHEFSLMSRIQAGEIKSTRARSGWSWVAASFSACWWLMQTI